MPKIFIFTTLLILIGVNVSSSGPLTWSEVDRLIKQNFPNTPEKNVTELAQLQMERTPFFLIDVRSKKEFEVSHIKDALNITSAARIQRQIPRKDVVIIAYCSVGYRSAKVVAELRKKGYTNAFNLKGSIFEWANTGHALYHNGKKTHHVHPYNRKWGVLLKQAYHPIRDNFWW